MRTRRDTIAHTNEAMKRTNKRNIGTYIKKKCEHIDTKETCTRKKHGHTQEKHS